MDLAEQAVRIPRVNRRGFLAAAAGLPFALRSGPAALAAVRGGTPLALVTADSESHLVAVELTSGRIHRKLATLPGPRSIESVLGRIAVVAHTAGGAITLIDGRSLEIVRVLRGLGAPRYTAGSPDGRYAFVTDSARGEVLVLDLRRARAVGGVDVDGPARHISIDRSGRQLWLALGSKAEAVAIVDVAEPTRPRLVSRVRPPFLAHDVGFAPGDGRVWVSSGDRGRLAVYEAARARVLFTLAAGSPPQHVTFLGSRVHVTSGDDGTLCVHRLQDGRLLRETAVPVGSYNVQQGFGLVLTPSLARGTLCILDAEGTMLHRVDVAPSSHDACFALSG